MGLDLDAIRNKLKQMTGNRANKVKFSDGKQRKFRLIAWPDNEGQPFTERMEYSIGKKNWGILAPSPDERDPVRDLTDSLRDRTGKNDEQAKEDWQLAKKLFPKLRHHAIVIDRDDEDAGPQIWQFGQPVAKRLYQILLDEDFGDITDIENGFDLKVTRTKEDNGFRKYTVDPRPRPCRLGTAEQVDKWMEIVADIDVDKLYKKKSYDELDQILQAYLNGDDEQDAGDTGTERNGKSDDDDDDAEDSSEDVELNGDKTFENLDDAFAALESE